MSVNTSVFCYVCQQNPVTRIRWDFVLMCWDCSQEKPGAEQTQSRLSGENNERGGHSVRARVREPNQTIQ